MQIIKFYSSLGYENTIHLTLFDFALFHQSSNASF